MDLALNNLQRLICHKSQATKPTNQNNSKLYKQNFIGSLTTIPRKVNLGTQISSYGVSKKHLNKKEEYLKSGWKLTARCPDNVDAIGRSPKKCLRKYSQELGLSGVG